MHGEASLQFLCLQLPYGAGVEHLNYLAIVFWIGTLLVHV